jgi:hypothetical protein
LDGWFVYLMNSTDNGTKVTEYEEGGWKIRLTTWRLHATQSFGFRAEVCRQDGSQFRMRIGSAVNEAAAKSAATEASKALINQKN